jgi:5-methylcytosine-specific restriction endonuclease McrA
VLDAVSRVSAELQSLVALLGQTVPCPETIAAVEAAGRLMDAARIRVAAPLARDPLAAEHLGFASAVAAVSSLAQVSERTARTRLCLASNITPDRSISGAPLPAKRTHLAAAIDAGRIGLDAASLVDRQLDAVAARVPADALDAAERVMVNLASGRDGTGERDLAPVSVDHLATEIRLIGSAIDPDGARPREERAARRRAFHVGQQDDDGLFPVGGRLASEVGVLLLGMIEAHRRSPRFAAAQLTDPIDDLADVDTRTPDQRRHDAFAEIVMAASSAKDAPYLDGAPVTVAIVAQQADLDRDDARDGYRCARPGCTSPHYALQVHHVVPYRDGGATTTDNGILLCYWDHQRVDDGPWRYRMVNGVPQVRGPGIPEWTALRPQFAQAA